MILRTAKSSPFGRKVWICLLRLGLMDRTQLIEADFIQTDDPLHGENPLGKMPVLTTDAGEFLFDSRVIIEYLDHEIPGVIMPLAWSERLRNLRMQSLCDGVMDAGALIVMEQRLRPATGRHQPFVEFQRKKISQALAALEREYPAPEQVHVGAVALACALGFLDRRKQLAWQPTHPRLLAWLKEFRKSAPEYDATYVEADPDYVSL